MNVLLYKVVQLKAVFYFFHCQFMYVWPMYYVVFTLRSIPNFTGYFIGPFFFFSKKQNFCCFPLWNNCSTGHFVTCAIYSSAGRTAVTQSLISWKKVVSLTTFLSELFNPTHQIVSLNLFPRLPAAPPCLLSE